MGNTTTKIKTCFNKTDLQKIDEIYISNFKDENMTQNNLNNLLKDLFGELAVNYKINIFDFLNKSLERQKKQVIKKFDKNCLILLTEFLLKSSTSEDAFLSNIYLNQSYIYIIYDIIKGSPATHKNNAFLDYDIILDIFNFIMSIYVNLHEEFIIEGVKNRYNKEKMICNLTNIFETLSIIDSNKKINKTNLDNFINENLISVDCLIKDYFTKIMIENNQTNIYPNNSLPTFQFGCSNIVSIDQFFLYCMGNPFLTTKKHAYKLYCCNDNGFNLSSVIYSFLGFEGPITILINHLNKDDSKTVLGIFLNSNFKECFENYVGDDSCFPFIIQPNLKFYKFYPLSINRNKILYLSSKNHKNTSMKPGVGLGYGYSGSKIWLDLNDLFKKSYFTKNETVFEEGSPFENDKEILNVQFLFILDYKY